MKPRAEQVKSKHKTQTKILNYILFFFVCAFIGWIWEIILTLIQTGNIVNRGVLHGPWLPIYGFGGVGILLLVGHLRKYPPLVFLTSAVFCGLMEYLTGWYLETVKHMKWWDYSHMLFNLHGRVCLLSVLCFGLCGLFVIYIIYPRFHDTFAKLKVRPKQIICSILVVLFIADFIYSIDHPNTGQGITSEIVNTVINHDSD